MIMDVIIVLIIRLILLPIWLWWLGVLIANTHFVYGADESNSMLNSDNKQQLQQIQLEEMEEGGDEL